MQANEFEKKIQEQMDQFSLEPAGEVWKKIEQQLPGEKRRWGGWFLILFALLLIGSGIAFIVTRQHGIENTSTANHELASSEDHATSDAATAQQDHTSHPTGAGKSTGNHSNALLPVSKSGDIAANKQLADNDNAKAQGAQEINLPANAPVQQNTPATVKMQVSSRIAVTVNRPAQGSNRLEHAKRTMQGTKKAIVKVTAAAPDELDTPDQQQEAVVAKEFNKSSLVDKNAAVQADSNNIAKAAVSQPSPVADMTGMNPSPPATSDSTAKKALAIQLKSKSKWSTGAWLDMGRLTLPGKSGNTSSFANDVQNSPSSGFGGQAERFQPATMKGGWALGAGVYIARELSDRISIQTGAGYRLLTSSMRVGARVYSSALSSGFPGDSILGGNSETYTTFYHQLSIPLSVGIQLSRPGSRSVRFNAGADFSWLLASNALQFNYATGLYYKSNALLNKTMVGVRADVAINLAAKGKSPLYIGPECYYAITPLAASGHYAGLLPIFVGIRIQKSIW